MAYDFSAVCESGHTLYYNITSSSSLYTVEMTYPNYDNYNFYYNYTKPTGNLVIPSSVIYNDVEYSVTSIDESAFCDCNELTSVTIPNSVTNIGAYAFFMCSGLSSVYYTGNIAQWCGITFNDQPLLYAHNLYINNNLVIDLVIPESVIEIKPSAFCCASCLTSVTIPNSVTSIGGSAFENCSGLTSVTIGNSVTNIGDRAFNYCSGLTSVTIPNSVMNIGESAFLCSGLTSVTIGNSVTSIGNSAFFGCVGLTSVIIPNSVTSIGEMAFANCRLEIIVVVSDNQVYDSRENSNAIIETETNTLVSGCRNTIIPNSVTSIGNYAFYYCRELTSVTISNSVTSIGNSAFSGCVGLTSLIIPNSVTSIGKEAFSYCEGLTSLTTGNSVESFGTRAFYDCSGLTLFTIPNSVTSIGGSAFYGTGWYNNQPDGILYLDGWCLGPKGLPTGELIINEGTKGIADFAFKNCSGLTSVTIGNSVTNIGNGAFSGCSGINAIYSNATNPPAIYDETFSGISSNIPIYVPCGRVSAYNNAEHWNYFSNIQENPDCAGVEENEIANLQVFPNPVGNTLNIISDETISEIEIVNTLGQVVYRTEVNADNAFCDVEGLKAGIYIVRIHGTEIYQQKFIKE